MRLPVRYEDLGRIARGGWGEIRRARDGVMDRVVVVKLLAWEHLDSPRVLGRFLNEATITASLEHPGVVPVYDRGTLEDGRPWFTMKEVRGRTLAALLREDAPRDVAALRRAVDRFARVCETVGYAHERGLVHRDLKPSNVMVGEFGEVLVLDWGVAQRRGERVLLEEGGVSRSGTDTEAGDILGTVEYMSPEQARGANELVDATSDVFALGLVLYEIITGRRARPRERIQSWVEAAGAVVPLLRADDCAPAELREVYEKSTRRERQDRQLDGRELGEAVRAWLDGAARRERAARAVAAADAIVPRVEALRTRCDALRREAARLLASLRPDEPAEEKVAAWRIEDEAAELEHGVAIAEAEQMDALSAALEHEPSDPAAHARLAAIYRTRLIECDARGNRADAARWEIFLRRHDRGEHASFLAGLGRVALDTEPSGAVARVLRVVLHDRRLVEQETGIITRTPFSIELPAGSFVIVLEHDGVPPVRYPVKMARDEAWSATRPGDSEATRVRMLATLHDDEVYVPAGWTSVGGDAIAAEPVASQRLWIDAFVIQRFPVTCADYLAFLDDLSRSGKHELAVRYAPRWPRGASPEEPLAVKHSADGFELAPDEHGRTVDPSWPVQSIDWHSAYAYAEWLTERTSMPWRLPNELEWEKAARGVDERVYPWGAQPEPSWARMIGSTVEPPCRAPVSSYPIDQSPYGVRGLAGNVRDWCGNSWVIEGPPAPDGILAVSAGDPSDGSLRTIKGGAWNSVPAFARSAGRFAMKPEERFSAVGFRLVRSVKV